jgi:hypothetical protein
MKVEISGHIFEKYSSIKFHEKSVQWQSSCSMLRFDPWSVHVAFVVDKVALGQVFPRVLRFSPVNFIPLVLHYKEKRKKLIIFITGLHNKP